LSPISEGEAEFDAFTISYFTSEYFIFVFFVFFFISFSGALGIHIKSIKEGYDNAEKWKLKGEGLSIYFCKEKFKN
jgi:hypothetical protein